MIWKDIKGYEGRYQVSETGQVKSLSRPTPMRGGVRVIRERILKQFFHPAGYPIVNFVYPKRKQQLVHRLVANAFIPNPENKPQVNHKDLNKKNPHISNLEWVTALENREHAGWSGVCGHILLNIETGIFYWSSFDAARSLNMDQGKLYTRLYGNVKNNTPFIVT